MGFRGESARPRRAASPRLHRFAASTRVVDSSSCPRTCRSESGLAWSRPRFRRSRPRGRCRSIVCWSSWRPARAGLVQPRSRRLATFGPNAVRSHHTSAVSVLIRQVSSPLLWLLLGAAAVSAFVGEGTRCPDHRGDHHRVRRLGFRERVPGRAGGRGDARRDPPSRHCRPRWRADECGSHPPRAGRRRPPRRGCDRAGRCPPVEREWLGMRRVDPHRRVCPRREVPETGGSGRRDRGSVVVSVHGDRRARGLG